MEGMLRLKCQELELPALTLSGVGLEKGKNPGKGMGAAKLKT